MQKKQEMQVQTLGQEDPLEEEPTAVFFPLILCRPHLLPPSIFPSIGVFSSESVLRIRWPKDWSFSFSISPSHVTTIHLAPKQSL